MTSKNRTLQTSFLTPTCRAALPEGGLESVAEGESGVGGCLEVGAGEGGCAEGFGAAAGAAGVSQGGAGGVVALPPVCGVFGSGAGGPVGGGLAGGFVAEVADDVGG